MKIALVFVQRAESEMPSRALAIETLAAHLRLELGSAVEIQLWDLQLTPPDAAIEEIAAFGPDIVGASVPIGCVGMAQLVLPPLADLPSRPLVVIGNLVATNAPADLLDLLPNAVLVRGEGEEPLAALLRRRIAGDRSLEGLSGLCWEDDDGTRTISNIHVGATFGGHVTDLWPQMLVAGGQALVESSRGCPARCSFCSSRMLHPDGWRRRPVDDLMVELSDLRDAGVSRVFFADDDFVGAGWDEAVQVASEIARIAPGLTWGTALRADSVSLDGGDRGLAALAGHGMRDVLVGIESGSRTQLLRLGKRANVTKNALAVERLQAVPEINLLAGFLLDPMMSVEEIRDTASFILENTLWSSISNPLQVVEVHFGTRLAETVHAAGIRAGFDLDTMTWSTHWLDPKAERLIVFCKSVDAVVAPVRNAIQRRYRLLTRRAVGSEVVDAVEVEWLAGTLSEIKRWQISLMFRLADAAVQQHQGDDGGGETLDARDLDELRALVGATGAADDLEVRRAGRRSADALAALVETKIGVSDG